MKKILLGLAILATSAVALAGTVYRDRHIPGGVCLVEFDKRQINASLIQDITIDGRRWNKWEGLFSGWVDQPPYQSLRVKLVNNEYYEIKDGDLYAARLVLLQKIKDECQ